MQSLGPFRTHFTSNCKVTKKYIICLILRHKPGEKRRGCYFAAEMPVFAAIQLFSQSSAAHKAILAAILASLARQVSEGVIPPPALPFVPGRPLRLQTEGGAGSAVAAAAALYRACGPGRAPQGLPRAALFHFCASARWYVTRCAVLSTKCRIAS